MMIYGINDDLSSLISHISSLISHISHICWISNTDSTMIQPTVPLGPRILLATANALKESNAKAQKPMPWMTARSHIKKDPGDPYRSRRRWIGAWKSSDLANRDMEGQDLTGYQKSGFWIVLEVGFWPFWPALFWVFWVVSEKNGVTAKRTNIGSFDKQIL